MTPTISVVMSVYNGQQYLDEAIESILDQTFNNFEFIIIDDASSDDSFAIIEHFMKQDERIRLIQNEENLGLSRSLNKGIKAGRGKYIARMDADDVSLPERFRMQLDFLENAPNVWVLGTNVIRIDATGNILREIFYPTTEKEMRWNMIWGNNAVVCHPSVMMVTNRIREVGLYRNQKTSQDLELWSRFFLTEPLPIANLEEPLLKYRVHAASISIGENELQHRISNQTRLDSINRSFKKTYSLEMMGAFRTLNSAIIPYQKQALKRYIAEWFEILSLFQNRFKLSNKEVRVYREQILYRTRTYVSLNPAVILGAPRIWLPNLLTSLRFKDWWNLLLYKLGRRFREN